MKLGYWIWNANNTEGGDAVAAAGLALSQGITDVMIKIADGVLPFNVIKGRDYALEFTQAMRAVDVTVWGWQYSYARNAPQEARIALRRLNDLAIDHFIIDAESEYKVGGVSAARAYLKEIRPYVKTLAYSTYRFPKLHPEFPFAPFHEACDLAMPQVYWEQATNGGAQLKRCLLEYRAMSPSKPIYPIGPAYKWNGWRPAPDQILDFEKEAVSAGLEMTSYWVWELARRDLPEIWNVTKRVPSTETPPDRLAGIEKSLEEVGVMIGNLSTSLQNIITAIRSVPNE